MARDVLTGPFLRKRSGNLDRCEPSGPSETYKWIVLSNTTIGMLVATINGSILLIALPDIFRGIQPALAAGLSGCCGSG
jgi:hypothetical protein